MPQSSRALWTAKLNGQGTPGHSAAPAIAVGPPCFRGIALGIDPSLRGTGLAVLDFTRGVDQGNLLFSQTLKLKPALSMHQCLGEVARTVTAQLDAYAIDCVALEQTIYVQNFQTAQILGAARGAAIAPVAMRNISLYEYAPLRIKQAVVGFGRASKQQVAGMVKQLLKLKKDLPPDESDAAATALCHALTWRETIKSGRLANA